MVKTRGSVTSSHPSNFSVNHPVGRVTEGPSWKRTGGAECRLSLAVSAPQRWRLVNDLGGRMSVATTPARIVGVNSFWLANLSMALDGTRYLAGDDQEPRVAFVDRVAFDTSDSGTVAPESVAAFLERLRRFGVEWLELVWVGSQRRGGASEFCEFSLVEQPSGGSWRLFSEFTLGGPDHGWTSTFRPFTVPDLTPPTIEQAAAALGELLDAAEAHPVESYRLAVAEAQSLLEGLIPVPDHLFGIRIDHLDDQRARLLAAAVAISAGKLSGMGGFDDAFFPEIAHLDIVSIAGTAVAVSTAKD